MERGDLNNSSFFRGGTWRHEGLILGMEGCGAVFVKIQGNTMFFDIPETFTQDMLTSAAGGISALFGMKLRVKRINRGAADQPKTV